MDALIARYCLSILLFTSIVTSANNTETNKDEPREPRVSGRIVKLYSGAKPEPYVCSDEGFQADPFNCAVFYRCVRERSGKFTVFRYQCAPGTVYDPDVETCNHAHSTRRSECGGMLKSTTAEPSQTANINEIFGAQSEVPRPISTKVPIYAEQSTYKNPTSQSWIHSTDHQSIPTTVHNAQNTLDTSEHKTTAFSSSTSRYQWSKATQHILENEDSSKTTSAPKTTQQSNSLNNDPCSSDGFMGDSENCRKFYRCVGNQRGGYIKYEFSCSETTVWDDEIQGCNHPWAVKRSKCERSLTYDDKTETQQLGTSHTTTKEPSLNNEGYGHKSNKTIQQQLQISHGTKVIQTQTQISNSDEVIQNQTQINYHDNNNSIKNSESKQNQKQISFGTAISQTQTQHDYGSKGVQTQLQIDHSKDSSQSQVQTQDSATTETVTSTQNINNSNNECSESGFMGDFNDCKKFYRCVNNGRGTYTKYQYFCGEGTVWDPEIEACNHAWAVKHCGGRLPSESTNKEHMNTTTIVSTEYHTQPTTTTQSYYTSSQGVDVDDGDVGYGNIQETTSSKTTREPTTITTTTTTTKTTLRPTVTVETSTTEKSYGATNECTSSGFIGDTNDCKIFYRCVDNGGGGFIKYEFKCGDGTLWDPDIEACNHAWAVTNCGGNVSSNEIKEETTTKKENTMPPQNIPETTVTLTQMTTQASTQITDDLDIGYGPQTHEPSTTIRTTTQSPKQETNKNSKCKSSGFQGDENDCNKFYRCVDDGNGSFIKYEFTCGEGTVWDSKIEACNHAWAVEKCGGSSNMTENTETTSQSIPTTSTSDTGSTQTTQSNKDTVKPVSTMITSTISSTVHSVTSNKCSNSGFMGDYSDCKKFYRCVDNGDGSYNRFEFTCGEGTVWDPKIEACNHAWAVDCGGSNDLSHTTQQTTLEHSIMQDEQQENGYATPSQDSFETSQTTTSTSLSSTTTLGETGHCHQSGFMGDQKDCKKFYRCVDNGKGGYDRYEFQCGEGTVWDGNIEACNHVWAVNDCRVSGSNTTLQNESTIQPITSSGASEDGQSQQPTEKTTTAKITTSTEKSGYESTQATKQPQYSQGLCESEGFHGNPLDCKKFYRCVDNGNGHYIKYDFDCGDGTIWNQDIQACDHESADKTCSGSSSSESLATDTQSTSTTSSYSTTKKETTNIIPSQTTESECRSEGFFAHPKECNKFIRCVNNGNGGYTRYEFSCGDGTVWVQEIQACDHDNEVASCSTQNSSNSKPQSTEEHSTGISESVISSTESMTPNKENDEYDESPKQPSHDESEDCTNEGYFGNKQDCKKFYRCVDNGNGGYTKYDFVCGDGTAWDSNLQTCNHINEVQSCSESSHESSENHQSTTNKNQAQTESPSSTTKQPPTSSSESSSISNSNSQDTCENEGYFGDSKDCKKFYRCVDNGNGGYTKYDFTCGDGTIWDKDITTCNHPQDVSNPSCTAVHETSDTSFTTSSTTHSSQTTSSPAESSSSSQEPSKQPESNVTCDKAGYYANPNDCKKFYRCVDWDGDGKKFSVFNFECGEGTIWDPALDTCNHEESVYPQRNCSQSQSQNVGGETTTSEGTTSTAIEQTTQVHTTSQASATTSATEQTTTQQPTTSEKTTTQESTTNESTTPQQTTIITTTTTTQQPTTTEKTTTQQPPTTEPTAQQTTTSEKATTQETTTSEQTTTQKSTTSEQTTTQEPTTSEKTTTQQSTSSETSATQEPSTSEPTTTQQSSTNEPTTAQQPTTSEQTTTQEPTTSEPATTQQLPTNEPTTTQQSTTSEQTTTQESTTTEHTTIQPSTPTDQTTQESTTSEQTTTQQPTTSEQTTTLESSTSEQTTTQQPTTTEQITTQESSTSAQTTTQLPSTTEQATTQESTTNVQTTQESNTPSEGTTTTEETTEQSSTQTSSTESDTEGQTSTESSSTSDKDCPETENDQYLLVCPTSFKRHPKYCNMFYQCTEDDDTNEAKVASFKCPNNTIYDENKTQCVTEDKADKKCNGEIANKRRFKRLGLNYKEPIIADKGKLSCSSTGHYSFEKNSECSKGFMKCERSKNGQLQGYVYQCPDGFIFWSISKRCERMESVRDCKKSINDWTGRWNIPVERKNVAAS